jgi:flagellin
MAVYVNTNVTSLMVQQSLSNATLVMDKAMERMSTGLRINSSADDPAGMVVSSGLDKIVSATEIAKGNAQMGSSMLATAESGLSIIKDNLVRIRDLFEQAATDTYGTDARSAIADEVGARIDEIDRISASTEFDGKKLISGAITTAQQFLVGTDGSASSKITISASTFANSNYATLSSSTRALAVAACASSTTAAAYIATVDTAYGNSATKIASVGSGQSRLDSAIEALDSQYINLSAASSLIKDADIAAESSNYVKAQILQQTSASLLSQANQIPAIAISLV